VYQEGETEKEIGSVKYVFKKMEKCSTMLVIHYWASTNA
jgi:hypothetical protein